VIKPRAADRRAAFRYTEAGVVSFIFPAEYPDRFCDSASLQSVLGVLSSGIERPLHQSDHTLPSTSSTELRMGGAVCTLPHTPSWRAQGKYYLYFLFLCNIPTLLVYIYIYIYMCVCVLNKSILSLLMI